MFSASKTAGPSGYNLTNSLRFRSSASASLTRTFGTPTSGQKWTMSFWFKRGILGVGQELFAKGNTSTQPWTFFYIDGNGALNLYEYSTSGTSPNFNLATNAVFRDPSSWYHIVVAVDTTQATAANRQIVYVNNVQQTFSSSSFYPQNTITTWNSSGGTSYIGRQGGGDYLDGYLTEINFIDGQQLTPSSFGSTNATTGVWQPARYTGTYGTNGFYLNFTDIGLTSGSNTGLGRDFSGNGNFWNTNNISVTAGATYDAMTDVPTLTSATVANYAVMNPVYKSLSQPTFSNANLTIASNTANYQNSFSTIETGSTGKYYCEFTIAGNVSSALFCGISNTTERNYFVTTADVIGATSGGYSVVLQSGSKYTNGAATSYGSAFNNGDVIQIAYDADNGKIWFGKNGTWFASGNPASGTNEAFSGITGNYCFGVTAYQHPTLGTSTYHANFGQRPFSYTPPTGFLRLNTFNLPTSTIVKGNSYMDATLYTGNGSTQVIVNQAQFKPDFVWYKQRNTTRDNGLEDSVRGTSKIIISNSTAAEVTASGITGFNSNGFSIGNNVIGNESGGTYVGWQWQAGQGTTSSNTAGSITSTTSVSTTAGFSIVTFNAGAAGNKTVGHGLGVAPAFWIVKSTGGSNSWSVGSQALAVPAARFLALDLTSSVFTDTRIWANTAPSSTVLSFESGYTLVANANAVAYCWAEIAGFSRFGSYTGNGSADGTFVYLGFRPAFVMLKNSNTTDSWVIKDDQRAANYNPASGNLYPNLNIAEDTGSGANIDFLSNGFKIRGANFSVSGNGNTIIYAAFAENPFKNALAR